MKKIKKLNINKTLTLKKTNHQVFTTQLLDYKVSKNRKSKYFYSKLVRRSKLMNYAKETTQMFYKLVQLQKLTEQKSLKYKYTQVNSSITNQSHLLSLRCHFFTKKWKLVGSLCWLWFFDVYEELNFRNEFEAHNNELEKSVQLRPRKFKKVFGKALVNTLKPGTGLLYNKRFLNNRKRNTRKIIKLLTALSTKNTKDVLKNAALRTLLSRHKKFLSWQTYIRRSVHESKIQKNSNPYLFLNNKSVKTRKFYKYSYDIYSLLSLRRLGPSSKRYFKSLFYSKKNKVTTKSPKKNFFIEQNIKSFLKKLPSNYYGNKLLKSTFLTTSAISSAKNTTKPSIKKKKFIKEIKRLVLYNKKIRGAFCKNIYNRTTSFTKTTFHPEFSKHIIVKNKIDNSVSKNFSRNVKTVNNSLRKIFKRLSKKISKKRSKKAKTKDKKPQLKTLQSSVKVLSLKIKWLRKGLLKFKIRKHTSSYISSEKSKNFLSKRVKLKYSVHRGRAQKWAKTARRSKYVRVTLASRSVEGVKAREVNYRVFKRVNTGFSTAGIKSSTNNSENYITSTCSVKKNNHISRGYTNYHYLTLNSKKNKSFTFRNVGVFLWSQRKKFFDKNTKTKFIFKKKLYSFLFPNEVRKAIMNRRKSLKSYRFIYNKFNLRKKKGYYSLVFFKANYKNFFRLNALTQALSLRKEPLNYSWLSSVKTREEVLYESEFRNKGHIENSRGREIFIKRIRFKPGYQRIWRQAREAALEHFKIRTVYQQQLTKYLSKFYRQAHFNSFMFLETTLGRTIVYSRLLPDYPSVYLFKEKNFIFLNRKSLPDLNTQVVPNDFIQLMVANWFYIYNRWVTNTTLLRVRKFKRLVYRKGMAHKYKVIKLRKQKSRYTPKWIYYSRFDHSDIKTYFEVDYFTMSMFVLYNPNTIDYSAPDDTIDLRISIYKMYNWKYIT